ncbi:MAG: succinate dehydrogenase, hydrophobic membrane anchor protein [Alphaproteobacteria bacterium]|nr:succinate dehydrogenase, hydrophobic membrane anchor protein [Alphaproteobacteria bacterium]
MTTNTTSLRSALGHARGLGSAKEGTHHWWLQRVTAIALVPLTMWLVASIIALSGFGHEAFVVWFGRPVNATLMILFLGVAFHHAQLGMQVFIEDYVSHHGMRTALNLLVKFACYGLATLSIVSILTIAFGA